jgi:hypothetical protein
MSYIGWVSGVLMPWGGVNLNPLEHRGSPLPPGPPDFDALCRGPSICGSPAEVSERILRMREILGLDVHIAMFDHGGIPEDELADALELFAAKVLPALSAA